MALNQNTIDYLLKIPILIDELLREVTFQENILDYIFCGKVDICGHLVMHYTVVMDHLSLLKVY